MNRILSILAVTFYLFGYTVVSAAHCSGGHEEIKETKETSGDNSESDVTSN